MFVGVLKFWWVKKKIFFSVVNWVWLCNLWSGRAVLKVFWLSGEGVPDGLLPKLCFGKLEVSKNLKSLRFHLQTLVQKLSHRKIGLLDPSHSISPWNLKGFVKEKFVESSRLVALSNFWSKTSPNSVQPKPNSFSLQLYVTQTSNNFGFPSNLLTSYSKITKIDICGSFSPIYFRSSLIFTEPFIVLLFVRIQVALITSEVLSLSRSSLVDQCFVIFE